MHKRFSFFHRLFTLKHIAVFLLLLIMICVSILVGYFIGFNQAQDERVQMKQDRGQSIIIHKAERNISKGSEQDREILHLKQKLKALLDREAIHANHEYAPKNKDAIPPPSEPKVPLPVIQGNAKLVIIMDDVSYAHDVKAIRSVGLPLVMSFLPPSPRHGQSAVLAKGESGYMVHLPLEAVDFLDEEAVTLRVADTKEMITAQIQKIKKLYPNVHYINNHTGSKFTADEDAMDRLISVMQENGLVFVDSRTTAQTKAKDIETKYGLRYLGRDVFLDHHDGVANIKKQIREAVRLAKRNGSAIAIGHPRPDTIQALRESKDILREVELVGIDKI
jgi:polysaccharide deacetylase 2 family uncharacterized protein YibQ